MICKGTLSALLIKPINIEANSFAKFVATKLPVLVLNSVLLFLTLSLIDIHLSLKLSPSIICACLLSMLLSFYFGLCLSTLAFWLIEMWPLRRIYQGCMTLLGGVIAPLDLLPDYISSWAIFSPFPFMGYFSIKALQGKLSENELQFYFIMAFVWTLFFAFGFRILWFLGLKRYEAVNI